MLYFLLLSVDSIEPQPQNEGKCPKKFTQLSLSPQ